MYASTAAFTRLLDESTMKSSRWQCSIPRLRFLLRLVNADRYASVLIDYELRALGCNPVPVSHARLPQDVNINQDGES
jgi:uncharacterized protein YqiB (DUF1249 family)